MAFLSDEQRDDLRIEQMVFHLVGPKPENFVRLEAIDPGPFADFFLKRIRAVNAGAPYAFSDASSTRTRLARIADNPDVFQVHGGGRVPAVPAQCGGRGGLCAPQV